MKIEYKEFPNYSYIGDGEGKAITEDKNIGIFVFNKGYIFENLYGNILKGSKDGIEANFKENGFKSSINLLAKENSVSIIPALEKSRPHYSAKIENEKIILTPSRSGRGLIIEYDLLSKLVFVKKDINDIGYATFYFDLPSYKEGDFIYPKFDYDNYLVNKDYKLKEKDASYNILTTPSLRINDNSDGLFIGEYSKGSYHDNCFRKGILLNKRGFNYSCYGNRDINLVYPSISPLFINYLIAPDIADYSLDVLLKNDNENCTLIGKKSATSPLIPVIICKFHFGSIRIGNYNTLTKRLDGNVLEISYSRELNPFLKVRKPNSWDAVSDELCFYGDNQGYERALYKGRMAGYQEENIDVARLHKSIKSSFKNFIPSFILPQPTLLIYDSLTYNFETDIFYKSMFARIHQRRRDLEIGFKFNKVYYPNLNNIKIPKHNKGDVILNSKLNLYIKEDRDDYYIYFLTKYRNPSDFYYSICLVNDLFNTNKDIVELINKTLIFRDKEILMSSILGNILYLFKDKDLKLNFESLYDEDMEYFHFYNDTLSIFYNYNKPCESLISLSFNIEDNINDFEKINNRLFKNKKNMIKDNISIIFTSQNSFTLSSITDSMRLYNIYKTYLELKSVFKNKLDIKKMIKELIEK